MGFLNYIFFVIPSFNITKIKNYVITDTQTFINVDLHLLQNYIFFP